MFAVGHMALAYLLGKGASRALKVKLNVPLIMVLSIIPDGDILLMPSLHRGPTHSLITALLIFLPIFVIYRKRAVPYFLGLISHAVFADFFIGGDLMLFWPLTGAEFGVTSIDIFSTINLAAELTLFSFAMLILFKTDDFRQFLLPNKTSLVLIIPVITVLLPSVTSYPLRVPFLMLPPHLFYLILFTLAILAVFYGFFRQIRSFLATFDEG